LAHAHRNVPLERRGVLSTDVDPARSIEYRSPPAKVSMADSWFEIASLEHFWVARRFEVFRRLADALVQNSRAVAEVGCGHGLLQRQLEDAYDREVTGFDLNDYALRHNLSRRSPVGCYDIYQRDALLRAGFDVVFLFDVLEHVDQEDAFLAALTFHLAPKGRLVINVPAGQWAYSSYDEAAGHVRRYSMRSLGLVAARNRFKILQWTYWGLPLLPALALRKLWLAGRKDESGIISEGFDSRSETLNGLLGLLSRCERIPQKLIGTSLMAVLELDQQT
jgi:SAM-dependent methyltransferase